MMMLNDTPQAQASKLTMALKGVLGFVLLLFGAVVMCYTIFWSQGDPRFMILFFGMGVLYLLSGVFPFIESVMYMNAEFEKDKRA
jgi:uncharacterized membrane protein